MFHSRRFSSNIIDESDKEAEIEHSSEDEVDSTADSGRVFSPEEKAAEAAAIGYNVIGPLHPSEKVFKPYEPVFAVVQVSALSAICRVNQIVIVGKRYAEQRAYARILLIRGLFDCYIVDRIASV